MPKIKEAWPTRANGRSQVRRGGKLRRSRAAFEPADGVELWCCSERTCDYHWGVMCVWERVLEIEDEKCKKRRGGEDIDRH